MMGEKELYELRKKLESELCNIEKKIYEMETYYLEETMNTGNLRSNFRQCHQRLGRLPSKKFT